MRIDGRALDELRSVKFTPDFTKFAEGSCLVEMGDTVVLCNASVEEKLPPHVRSGGWITAEYSMLPRANRERSKRDISKLKLNGRSAEIQRLIGRSLRSAVDLSAMEGVSIVVDCDVLQGDGRDADGVGHGRVCRAGDCAAPSSSPPESSKSCRCRPLWPPSRRELWTMCRCLTSAIRRTAARWST